MNPLIKSISRCSYCNLVENDFKSQAVNKENILGTIHFSWNFNEFSLKRIEFNGEIRFNGNLVLERWKSHEKLIANKNKP